MNFQNLDEKEYKRVMIRYLQICESTPDMPEYQEMLKLIKFMEAYESLTYDDIDTLN